MEFCSRKVCLAVAMMAAAVCVSAQSRYDRPPTVMYKDTVKTREIVDTAAVYAKHKEWKATLNGKKDALAKNIEMTNRLSELLGKSLTDEAMITKLKAIVEDYKANERTQKYGTHKTMTGYVPKYPEVAKNIDKISVDAGKGKVNKNLKNVFIKYAECENDTLKRLTDVCQKVESRDAFTAVSTLANYSLNSIMYDPSHNVYWGTRNNLPMKAVEYTEKVSYLTRVDENDDKAIMAGWEWANENSGYETVTVDKTYPEKIKYEYRKYNEHPEFAVISRSLDNTLIFDTEGKLVYVLNFKFDVDVNYPGRSVSTKNTAKRSVYIEDYLSDKYEISKEPERTQQIIRQKLEIDDEESSKLWQIYFESMPEQLELQKRERYATSKQEKMRIQAQKNKKVDAAAAKMLSVVLDDLPHRERANEYIKQLEKDREKEFENGRRFRVSETAADISYCDKDGIAKHVFRIQYVQTTPFEAKPVVRLIVPEE